MKMIKILVACLSLAAAQFALAGKVVVLDLQQAILSTDLAKHRQAELAKKPEYAKMIAEAEGYRADLEALEKEAKSEGLTWSQEQFTEHKKNVEFIQGDMQRVFQKIQAEQNALVQGIVKAVKQEFISDAVTKLVKSEGIDLVLRKEVSNFASPEADITLKVAQEINKALTSAK